MKTDVLDAYIIEEIKKQEEERRPDHPPAHVAILPGFPRPSPIQLPVAPPQKSA